MKILLNITRSGRRIKWLVACFIIMLSFQSCDFWYILPLDNNKFSYDVAFPDNDTVKTSYMYFNGMRYLIFDLKGEYVLNPDSLKLKYCDDNIKEIGKSRPFSETDTYYKNNTRIKNRLIEVELDYERINKNIELKEPLVMYILPSDFIMKDGKRVLTDSMRIVLRKPMKDRKKGIKHKDTK